MAGVLRAPPRELDLGDRARAIAWLGQIVADMFGADDRSRRRLRGSDARSGLSQPVGPPVFSLAVGRCEIAFRLGGSEVAGSLLQPARGGARAVRLDPRGAARRASTKSRIRRRIRTAASRTSGSSRGALSGHARSEAGFSVETPNSWIARAELRWTSEVALVFCPRITTIESSGIP